MSDLDILAIQNSEEVKNTFYRYPRITPHINKFTDHLEIKTIDDKADLYKIDEVVLYIISDFKFAPIWLIQQWYEDFGRNGYDVVQNWIKTGICWAEASSMGVFIRPTKFLLDLMTVDNKDYVDIPFGLLNHTCAEEQIVFDVMMGNPKSELWYNISQSKLLPCYHPLKLQVPEDKGTIVIREEHFKVNHFKQKELEEKQDLLIRSVRENPNNPYTIEFQADEKGNFPYFTLVGYTEDNKMSTQKPDVVIPIPRVNGQAQSCSIELELTAKNPEKYDQIMRNYKNNIVFGKLFYLCGNSRIADLVTSAYKNIGGLGSCRLFIVPYVAPAQRLSNYNIQDEQTQKTMIKLTTQATKPT